MCQVLICDPCLAKAELNIKNSTRRRLCRRLVEFLMFNSIYWKKSDPPSAENRVGDKLYLYFSSSFPIKVTLHYHFPLYTYSYIIILPVGLIITILIFGHRFSPLTFKTHNEFQNITDTVVFATIKTPPKSKIRFSQLCEYSLLWRSSQTSFPALSRSLFFKQIDLKTKNSTKRHFRTQFD